MLEIHKAKFSLKKNLHFLGIYLRYEKSKLDYCTYLDTTNLQTFYRFSQTFS